MSTDKMIKTLLLELSETEIEVKDFPLTMSGRSLPRKNAITEMVNLIMSLMFPGFFIYGEGEMENKASAILKILFEQIALDYKLNEKITDAKTTAEEILSSLPGVKKSLLRDAHFIYEGDPAAGSVEEVILTYPGFFAIAVYRIAHLLYNLGATTVSRMMTEYAHSKTGIDIHPGAKIGESFFIDHGTGIVIGETAIIGNRVKIYQGVTIGAKSIESDSVGVAVRGGRRHPEIGNGCVIYAGATILGADTKIGNNCIIGGNVWLTHSVPDGQMIYYKEKGLS